MTRPIAQNADPAFTAGAKGTFRLLDGEWRVWGAGIGPEFVNAPMTEAESEAIHLSIRRDCRCGTESGIRSTAAQMRLQPSLSLQRWVEAPDFPSESAGTGLTSLKRKRNVSCHLRRRPRGP